MNQREIVLCFARKELSAIVIHHDLRAKLGSEAVSYSSVTRSLHEAIFGSANSPRNVPETEPQFDDCDQAILLALTEQLFAPIRELGRLTQLPRTTMQRRSTQSFGFRVRHLRRVPHVLSDYQKLDRVRLSQQLLSSLERQERRSWHDMVALDESWFYLNMDHELICLQPNEETPERERLFQCAGDRLYFNFPIIQVLREASEQRGQESAGDFDS
jgi:hypothetical protein